MISLEVVVGKINLEIDLRMIDLGMIVPGMIDLKMIDLKMIDLELIGLKVVSPEIVLGMIDCWLIVLVLISLMIVGLINLVMIDHFVMVAIVNYSVGKISFMNHFAGMITRSVIMAMTLSLILLSFLVQVFRFVSVH